MRMQSALKIQFCFVIAVLVLFVGCTTAPLQVAPVDKTENPTALIKKLGEEIARARDKQVDVLSPEWFEKAVESHTDAKSGLDKGEALAKILENVATGQAELERAEIIAGRSMDILAEAIQSRQDARAVNAQQFDKDYTKTEDGFLKLTKAIEEDDFQYARENREQISTAYRELELRAITNAALDDVRQLLKTARNQKVHKLAPKSFAHAQRSLAEAEAAIAKDRYDKKMIQHKSSEARFFAHRAQAIAQASRKLETMGNEDIALWLESYLYQTTSQLQSADRRNAVLDQQQQSILEAIAALQKERDDMDKELQAKAILIDTLSDRLSDVEGTSQRVKYDKERLAAEKRFSELFNKVQGYFSPAEAEVYKQTNQLIIRLKGIQFPVGQSIITPDNYALLSKVQKAIQTFGEPKVVIEGHTDITGSVAKNQALSRSRAQSVLQYLVANRTLPASKISARGYGSERPVASNATAKGRAANRRIDVVIKPQMTAMP